MSDEQIERFGLIHDVGVRTVDEGPYVLYDDHKAAMEKKDAELKESWDNLNNQLGSIMHDIAVKDARIRELEEACKVLAKAYRLWQIQNTQSFTDSKWKKFTIRREFAKRGVLSNPVARKYVEGKG